VSQSVESVAAELKRMSGKGATPQRLALCQELRKLAGVSDTAGLVEAGYAVLRFLVGFVDSLQGSYNYRGRTVEAATLNRVYKLLFKWEASNESAPERRKRAIWLLRLFCTVDYFRKPFGPEMDLMVLLAEEITKPPLRRQI
jgi:hypothetical protein